MKIAERPAPSAWQIQKVMRLSRETVENLRVEHGQVFDDGDDMLAALTEEGVGVDDIIRRLVRSALDDKASAAGAKLRMTDLKARFERFERHEDAKRATVLSIMEALGLSRFVDPEFSLSVSPGKPGVIITSESELPEWAVVETVVRTPDKAAIKAALELGDVAGAVLSQASPVLTVRSK
jgi:Siphovirus Gp157